MSNILVFAFLFFIGSCMGWCMEVIFRRFFSKANPSRKWINPGFLTGPYLPLYGFGLWGMYFVSGLENFSITSHKAVDIIIILVLMAVFMTVIEYIAGMIFIKCMHMKLWDYTGKRGNIKGIICPQFSIIWGILGCFYYFVINPYVIGWVIWLSKHLAFSFFVGMFFGIFIIDIWYSLQISHNIEKFAKEKDVVIKYEGLKEHIRQRREELKERRRFLLSFKSELTLRQHLEGYMEEVTEIRRKKKKHTEDTFKR